MLNKEDTWR